MVLNACSAPSFVVDMGVGAMLAQLLHVCVPKQPIFSSSSISFLIMFFGAFTAGSTPVSNLYRQFFFGRKQMLNICFELPEDKWLRECRATCELVLSCEIP
jgi:hypothetical protein